jgi:cytochrome c553
MASTAKGRVIFRASLVNTRTTSRSSYWSSNAAQIGPLGATMKAICINLSAQDMRAVAAFVEAFPQEGGMATGAPADQ